MRREDMRFYVPETAEDELALVSARVRQRRAGLPIVAALLLTVWDIYGAAFKDILPPVPEAVAPQPDAEPKG